MLPENLDLNKHIILKVSLIYKPSENVDIGSMVLDLQTPELECMDILRT